MNLPAAAGPRTGLSPCGECKRRAGRGRISLLDIAPVHATLIHTEDQQRRLTLRLGHFFRDGLGGIADPGAACGLHVGDCFWAAFRLPGEAAEFQFIIRLARRRATAKQNNVVMGFAFCAQDDPTRQREQIARLERFAARCRPGPAGPHTGRRCAARRSMK